MKYMTSVAEFWRRHRESRKKIDEELANLPYEKKLEILEKMQANHEAMRNAKGITEIVGDG